MTVSDGRPTIRFPNCLAAVRRPALAARKDEVFAAVLEGLKARLDQLLRDGSRGDPRAYAVGLREAIVEARLGVAAMRDHLAGTERELADEQRQLADAIRRGKLAAMVPDPETVRIADRYAERHRQRVAILERKLAVQKDELAMAERELADMTNEARQATAAHPSDSIAAAWRDLESAGGERPGERERDQAEHDRRRRESAIEAQLAYLKKKLGKQ